MNFSEELKERTSRADAVIRQYLPPSGEKPERLTEAMNYSMTAGGKRIRPVLMWEAWKLCGGTGETVRPFMAAIEMVHTHSLIHDDLPAIDNDAIRRGKPTTHARYGEALGLLAGDALLNYAYETALKAFGMPGADPERTAEALRILAEKTGYRGMLGGQSVDVENEKNEVFTLDKEALDYIYLRKTAALLEASLMIGAVLAGAGPEQTAVMEGIGRNAGLAFQIRDDILDVTGKTEDIGKPVGSDIKNHKTTYVTLFGEDGAEAEVRRLTGLALQALQGLQGDALFLRNFLLSLAERKK